MGGLDLALRIPFLFALSSPSKGLSSDLPHAQSMTTLLYRWNGQVGSECEWMWNESTRNELLLA